MVGRKVGEEVKEKCQKEKMKRYLMRKFKWSDKDIKDIDWEGIREIQKDEKRKGSVTYFKVAHRWEYMGERRRQRGEKEFMCPGCGKEEKGGNIWKRRGKYIRMKDRSSGRK